MTPLIDRVHRLPRVWSNRELARFAPMFGGEVVNVSAWTDTDKEGRHYRDYFTAADRYSITNYLAEARGFQGLENEIFLDLEKDPPAELVQGFDCVLNHTTLEHIYEARLALANLCKLSRDTVILVLPFLQQFHASYGDYWRFTPMTIKRMFEENDFELVYQSFNTHRFASVYTFSIASRQPEKWRDRFDWTFGVTDPGFTGSEPYLGCRAIPRLGQGKLRQLKRRVKCRLRGKPA